MPHYGLAHEEELFIADICCMLLTLIGNIMVVYFICGSKRARTTHNITIVSMSISHIITASFVQPTHLAMMKRDHMSKGFTQLICKLNRYVWYWCKTVNIYSVIALMFDRYFKVLHPYKQGYMSGRCLFFLNFVWFFGAAYNIWEIILNEPTDFTLFIEDRNVTLQKCLVSKNFTYLKNGFIVTDFILIYLLPLVVLTLMTVCICMKAYVYQDARQDMAGNYRFCMALLLAFLFYACQLPLEIVQAAMFVSKTWSRNGMSNLQWCESLSFGQGLLHAVIYACCGREVALAVKTRRLRRQISREEDEGHVGPQILLTTCSNENVTQAEGEGGAET